MSDASEGSPAERVAMIEVTFRRANEMISEAAKRAPVRGRIPFICECGNRTCLETVRLTAVDYEAVRGDPVVFLVAPGHEITGPDLGRVARSEALYTLVEKIGASAEIARRRDPRQQTTRRPTDDRS